MNIEKIVKELWDISQSICTEGYWCSRATEILTRHWNEMMKKLPKKVTRETFDPTCKYNWELYYTRVIDNQVIGYNRCLDDIMSILKPSEPVWCEHCKVKPDDSSSFRMYNNDAYANGWKFCPICGKPKPAEENLNYHSPELDEKSDDEELVDRLTEVMEQELTKHSLNPCSVLYFRDLARIAIKTIKELSKPEKPFILEHPEPTPFNYPTGEEQDKPKLPEKLVLPTAEIYQQFEKLYPGIMLMSETINSIIDYLKTNERL